MTDINGNKTEYIYDKSSRLKEITSTVNDTENKNEFKYTDDGDVSVLKHNGCTFNFGYDTFGDMTSVMLGSSSYLTVVTDYENSKVTNTYANGYSNISEMDEYGNVVTVKEGSNIIQKNLYCDERSGSYTESSIKTSGAKLRETEDLLDNGKYVYSYDSNGEVSGVEYIKGDATKMSMSKGSTSTGGKATSYTVEGESVTVTEEYNNDIMSPVVTSEQYKVGNTTLYTNTYDYDGFMGVKNVSNSYDTKTITHNYTDASDDTLVSMTYANNGNSVEHTLREDKKHNIVGSVIERTSGTFTSTVENAYAYDGLNRLISETEIIGANVKTKTYSYDAGGNILSKTDGSDITTYHYENEWKDQLSRVTIDGKDKYFTYDESGNPTRYMTNSKTSAVNMQWTRGRMLSRCNGTSFTYYANGLRKNKINSNLTQTYYYAGDTLIGEVWSNGLQISYIYGKMGIEAMRVKSGNEERIFKYVTDCFGSVIEVKELVNGALESRLKCSYDAWGNRTVSGGTSITFNDGYSILMSNLNPFYYRGYYYDIETKFYYLQTRYYDPALGRFINPDTIDYLDPESINGLNLYAYCNNNPVMYIDPTGHFVITCTMLLSSIITSAVIGGTAAAISSIRNGDEWYEVALKAVGGAALGGMFGAVTGIGAGLAAGGTIGALTVGQSVAVGLGIATLGTATVGGLNSVINQTIDNNWDFSKIDAGRVVSDAFTTGLKGLLSLGAGALLSGIWDIPKGMNPGAVNAVIKTGLNTIIGTGWRATVDIVYATILKERSGWLKLLEWISQTI